MAKAPNPFAKSIAPKKPALKSAPMKNNLMSPNPSAGQTPMAMNSLKKGGMVKKVEKKKEVKAKKKK